MQERLDTIDERLELALDLLRPPARKPVSAMMPLLASVGLAGAGILLALVVIMSGGSGRGGAVGESPYTRQLTTGDAPPQPRASRDAVVASDSVTGSSATSAPAAFELSGKAPAAASSSEATPPVRQAVLVGTEGDPH